ncbi:MAG: DMT family transporter [Candidatus Bathyarchaeia archaeon]
MRLRSWLLFLTMVLLWAFNWSVMKRGLALAPPFTFVFHRFLLSRATLLVVLLILRPPTIRGRATLGKVVVASLLNVASFVATNIGLSSQSSGVGAVLTYTQPLMVFGLAAAFLKEEASKLRLAGTVLGFAGVSVLFLETGSSWTLSLPVLSLVLGAFFWAASTIYYKRFLNHANPVFLNVLAMAIGLPVLGGFSLALENATVPLTATYVAIILYAGIGASTIGTTLWLALLKDEDATTLASSTFIVPIMALGFGWWLLGESLDVRTLIGAALILVGIYLVNQRTKRTPSEENERTRTVRQPQLNLERLSRERGQGSRVGSVFTS